LRSALRPLLADDIERAWSWLERWGHEPCRISLGGLTISALLDLRHDVQTRVQVLAAHWERWW
jgi:hypothetical protein